MRKEEYIIYGTDTCVFCDRAKTILNHYDKNWSYVDIMESPEIQKAFFKKTNNAKTVPQVFMYDPVRSYGNEELEVLIGGYENLEQWLKELSQSEMKKCQKAYFGVDKFIK